MKQALLLYGATGFTGRLIARQALSLGLPLAIAGRDANAIARLGEELRVPAFVADVANAPGLEAIARQFRVVLNAAGPFRATARPWIEACLRARSHYLDISGEPDVIEATARRADSAYERGVMLMSGVGFDVVASDCLLVHVASRVRRPKRIWLALSGLSLVSRGSAYTLIDRIAEPVWVRRGGHLQTLPPGQLTRAVDFGAGPVRSCAVGWGDVASAFYSTGARDVTAYFEASAPVQLHTALVKLFGWLVPATPWQELLRAAAARMPAGPSDDARSAASATLVAQAEGADEIACARMSTPEAYTLTARTSTAIARAVLDDDFEPGFETPGRLFGPALVRQFPGVTLQACPAQSASSWT